MDAIEDTRAMSSIAGFQAMTTLCSSGSQAFELLPFHSIDPQDHRFGPDPETT